VFFALNRRSRAKVCSLVGRYVQHVMGRKLLSSVVSLHPGVNNSGVSSITGASFRD